MADSNNTAGAITPSQSLGFAAAGNALGTLINSFAQRDLMETQQNINYANWQAQNDYNLPVHQLERYKQAGLSSAAAAQAISGIENSAGSVGSVTPGHPASGFDALKHYFADQQLMLDKRLNDIEVQKKEAEKDYLNELTNRNKVLTPLEADQIRADIVKKYSEVHLNEQERECRKYMLERAQKFEKWELQEIKTRIRELNSEVFLNVAKAGEARSQSVLNYQMTNESDAREQNIREDTKSKEYENRRLAFEEITRNFFHADPNHAPWMQFIEASAHGDEGATSVWNALLDFADEGINTIGDFAKGHPLISAWALHRLYQNDFGRTFDNVSKVGHAAGSFLPFFGSGSVTTPTSGFNITPNSNYLFRSTGSHQYR